MMIMAESSNEEKKERWIRPTRWLDIFVFLEIRFMPVS